MSRYMYDSIDPSKIPADAQIVAGYTSGHWVTFPTLAAKFPNAVLVSIAVNAAHDADVLDVEAGDATPMDAPGWSLRQAANDRVPTIYCSQSVWPAVVEAFQSTHVPLPLYWMAHYDGAATLPAGCVAKQYTDGQLHNAPNNVPGCDTSIVADYWPGVDPPTKPIGDDPSVTPDDLLKALDAAMTSTLAGTPVDGTKFIDGLAKRIAQFEAIPKAGS
jgi:hypothetical protein